MKKKIINGVLVFAMLLAGMSTFVACKDYDEESYNELKSRLNQEMTLRQALEEQVKALDAFVKTINSCKCDMETALKDYLTKGDAAKTYVTIENFNAAIDLLNQSITKINNTLGDVDLSKGTVAEQLNNLNTTILNVQAIANQALELAQAGNCDCDLTPLQNGINDLNTKYLELDGRLTTAEANAAEALAKYTALEARVAANRYSIDSLANVVKNLPVGGQSVDLSDYVTKEQLEAAKAEALAAAAEAKALAQEAFDKAIEALDKANANELKIAQLQEQMESCKTYFASKIAALEGQVAVINTRLDGIDQKITDILTDISKIQNTLKSMITGIELQATQSPVIGYLNTPLDVRSNVLAAYYGEVTSAIEFPATGSAQYLEATDINMLTDRNYDVMGLADLSEAPGYFTQAAGRFVSKNTEGSEEGNAGTLYLTINPNTVDFTGAELEMETSQANPSPIKLSPLKKSDEELSFGYTRAANNGFYEAQATLKEADIDNAKIRIDYKSLEDDAKAMLKERTKASVLEMGATLLRNAQDVAPAYGIKAPWKDGEGVEHAVYSEYALITAAIKPLSFAFMKDYKVTRLPGLGRLQSLVGQIIDRARLQVNITNTDFSKYQGSITFQDFDLSGIAAGSIKVKINYTLKDDNGNVVYVVARDNAGRFYYRASDGKWYNDEGATVNMPNEAFEAFNITVNVEQDLTPDVKNALQEVIDELNAQFGASSDLAKNITDLMNDVASLGNLNTKINSEIANAKNSIKTQINNAITRAGNKIMRWFNNAHKLLYITMMGKDEKSTGLISQSVYMPTKVGYSSLELIPTTYTIELLAPAYKKFVAVTNVYNASDRSEVALATAKSMASAANGNNMFKVIDNDKTCTINGQKGYIYEVTYTAIDYHGKVAIKKYYIEFV